MLPCYHFQKKYGQHNSCTEMSPVWYSGTIFVETVLMLFICVITCIWFILKCANLSYFQIKSESLSGQSQSDTAHKILVILTEKHKRMIYGIFYCLQDSLGFPLIGCGWRPGSCWTFFNLFRLFSFYQDMVLTVFTLQNKAACNQL